MISGFHRERSEENWKPIGRGYYVSGGTEIIPISDKEAGVYEQDVVEAGAKKTRGRRSSFKLELPKNKKFTLHDLAKQYDRPVSFIYNHFKKVADLCREVERIKGKKGRGTPVYIVE